MTSRLASIAESVRGAGRPEEAERLFRCALHADPAARHAAEIEALVGEASDDQP